MDRSLTSGARARLQLWRARKLAAEAALWAQERVERWRADRNDALNLAAARLVAREGSAAQAARRIRSDLQRCCTIRPGERHERLALLARHARPGAAERLVAEAQAYREHRFDLLGSGERALGAKLDWHHDPVSGHRWPRDRWYRRFRAAGPPGGPDIKWPWELSRCQHLLRLAQAAWLTQDGAFVTAGLADIKHWLASNRFRFGVNWACAMDVAIRAVNWTWWLAMSAEAPELPDEDLVQIVGALELHGRHVAENLEGARHRPGNNNHYLANLTGLAVLGQCFPCLPEARRWARFGLDEIFHEIGVQVGRDGADYEGSIPYHRLVAELVALPLWLAVHGGEPLPPSVRERLVAMAGFVTAYTKPDGRVPIVGDQDNGRVLRATAWSPADREWGDHRYLAPLLVLPDAPDVALAGAMVDEALWWLPMPALGRACAAAEKVAAPARSAAFRDTGIYVLREGAWHVVVSAGGSGTGGTGGHSHDDAMSFELSVGATTYVVDPGSGVYTQDHALRNRLRSAQAHSVVLVDGRPPTAFDPSQLFTMREKTAPAVLLWEVPSGRTRLALERSQPAASGLVTHRREFDLEDGRLQILDAVRGGRGEHDVELRLQVPASATIIAGGALLSGGGEPPLRLRTTSSPPMTYALEPSVQSPSYGQCRPSTTLVGRVRTALPWSGTMTFEAAQQP